MKKKNKAGTTVMRKKCPKCGYTEKLQYFYSSTYCPDCLKKGETIELYSEQVDID